MLVLYTRHHAHDDNSRMYAKQTAAFHTFMGGGSGAADHFFDQVPVLKIPTKEDEQDGLCSAMRLIYDWYEEVVVLEADRGDQPAKNLSSNLH